jgi:hypothetical protein
MGKQAGKQLIVLVAGVLAAALVVAGCGSSDSSISKAEFVKKADAVCKKGEEEVQKDFGTFAKKHENVKKPTEADYAELVDAVLVENVEAEVNDIRALGAPEGDEKEVEAMLEAREESIEKAQDNPKAVIKSNEDIFGEASKLAKAYGLKECGNR